MLAGSRLPGTVKGSGRATSSALTVPGKRNESLASDRRQKLILSAVIAPDARKSFVEIVFCQIAQRAVSDQKSGVNNDPQVKIASPQWDSRARPREASAPQVHRVTKDRASFPWPLVRHRFVRTFA